MKGLYHRNSLIIRKLHACATLFRQTPQNLKGKKHSSQLWLTRQIKDPYVEMAKQENYRCRSAFKLVEINERFKILSPGQVVIDCGAAPGSWTQVAVKETNADGKTDDLIGKVVAIDKLSIHPIQGASILSKMDFTNVASQSELLNMLNGQKADVVLSDMAPNACGVRNLDHDNIIKLAYAAMKFALQVTRIDGTLLCKVWEGGMSQQLEKDLLRFYKTVKSVRPQATRDESTEKFFLARGFRGVKNTADGTM
ncbi:PREDICTED: rRNA methyltransferase 2, mitochondrial [Dufourea novaeangliae]|uniref:rRNA methyltransferase 2, mitochondrial n=1 Tax=Dufourea novaeangliae TaxID=178035 RepID=A0A154PRT1_DUFNO|nr:PREDICTED: rRNA methyltransferase 2, mitochondrial [Dufourea novaeangliae]KZC13820.1 Putative ribosomal RNA methyltransferase CG11447 [Dufourea novaeangliae]